MEAGVASPRCFIGSENDEDRLAGDVAAASAAESGKAATTSSDPLLPPENLLPILPNAPVVVGERESTMDRTDREKKAADTDVDEDVGTDGAVDAAVETDLEDLDQTLLPRLRNLPALIGEGGFECC